MRDSKQVLGVIGNPVSHSLSPQMHTAALKALEIPWVYERCLALDDREARQHMSDVRVGSFFGLNVTTPFKQLALAECDDVSPAARIADGANTLYLAGGKLCGENTDGTGAITSLERDCNATIASSKVLVLGTGPTAAAIAWEAGQRGAREIIFVSREKARAQERAEKLLDAEFESRVYDAPLYRGMSYEDFTDDPKMCHAVDVIVNATTLGMKPNDPSPLNEACFQEGHAILDVVYGTPQPTQFFAFALNAGARVSDGRGMLVGQGAASLAIWTGLPIEEIPRDVMRAAVDEVLEDRLKKAQG